MHRPFISFVLLSGLAGCATAPGAGSTAGASGDQEGVRVQCSGPDSSWVFCYRTAAEMCGIAGYEVLARVETAASGNGPGSSRQLRIRCR